MISQNYDITSTRQLVVAGENQNRTVYLQIVGNSTVYVGGSGVTSSLGVP